MHTEPKQPNANSRVSIMRHDSCTIGRCLYARMHEETLSIQQLQGNTPTQQDSSRHPGHPAKHHKQGMETKPSHAGTLQQPMFTCGHTHASPEPCPIGLCKHPQTRMVHQEVTPKQPNANLPQSACNKGRSRDPTRAGCYV
jgi:hypothetical protein